MKAPFLLAALFACLPALATARATDDAAVRFPAIVDANFVANEAVLPKLYGVAIVDTRPTAEGYDPGHIPTALSIPDDQFDRLSILLPRARSTLLIFYCEDAQCVSGHRSAYKAERLGYRNVKVYAGGYRDWLATGHTGAVSIPYLKQLVDTGAPVTIVDTRRHSASYDRGHIPGAISIPTRQFARLAGRLPPDKSTPLIFYCDGLDCGSCADSAAKAVAMGYTDVMTAPDGYSAWIHLFGTQATARADYP
jgi:rhodanese-related sulfurtransferase